MKVLGIIPARFASTRFPGKPLAEIDGKSMIMRVYDQAKKVNALHTVVVATDDQRIFDHVTAAGGAVMMTAGTHQSGTDRCGEILQLLNDHFDVVVNIQGDEPFIQPVQIEKLIHAFADAETEIATLAKSIFHTTEIQNPHVVKVVFNMQHRALYFSRSVIPFPRNDSGRYFKHIGLYAYRSAILKKIVALPQTQLEKTESLEQLRWLENGYSITVVETDIDTTGIDTPEDLANLIK